MKKYKFTFLFLLFFVFLFPMKSEAQVIASNLSGRILLDVERNGEAWYIYPKDNKRYYLGRPHDAFAVMRELGLGINEVDFQKIASADMEVEGDLDLAKRLAGLIILQVEKNGEAWYINPLTYKKHYLGRPNDAFKIMRELGLGINRANLARINKNTLDESIDDYSSYRHRVPFLLAEQTFWADIIEINLNNPNLKIITDTANEDDCTGRCPAKTLIDYVLDNDDAFAVINGSYFDTSWSKLNYYFFPVYNSRLNKFINTGQLRYPTTGPIMVFDENNKFYYFKDSRDFASVENFESKYGVKLQAAIGNKPRLIENKQNLLIDWEVDYSQLNNKALRNAIAFKADNFAGKGTVYLVVLRDSTVVDLAEILKLMEVDYAINLDGGGSSALYYNGEYMIGPGRNIPNAILFSHN